MNFTKAAETDNTPSAAAKAENVAATKAPRLSWGLDDVVKLSKAGVDESVIQSYIQNSGVGYNPTAQDIIQLRELGVSPQIAAALMQRGSEVRQTATVEAQKQAQAAAPAAAPAQAAPVYTEPATYVAPASTVAYIGYPSYAYSYGGYYGPSYYSYPYYPRYYGYYGGFYPGVSVGFRFGSGYSGGHGGYHGGYHGGSHGGSHGGGGHHR
ncbi:MAG TPA: hypothetical protein VFR76_12900 [Verrucomicrobiae bacterium]|nr:hypothetical protein [Verrucomicrobiae bacterium]